MIPNILEYKLMYASMHTTGTYLPLVSKLFEDSPETKKKKHFIHDFRVEQISPLVLI